MLKIQQWLGVELEGAGLHRYIPADMPSKKLWDAQVVQTMGDASCEDIRASILHQQSPIHSYLFDKEGQLLIANLKASGKWKTKGEAVEQHVDLSRDRVRQSDRQLAISPKD